MKTVNDSAFQFATLSLQNITGLDAGVEVHKLEKKEPFIIWLCLKMTGNYQIHEFDWLKSILKAL